ncbi:MAG: hypothetical protein QXL15_02480 [Candidatus Korarchaeota archaeon]
MGFIDFHPFPLTYYQRVIEGLATVKHPTSEVGYKTFNTQKYLRTQGIAKGFYIRGLMTKKFSRQSVSRYVLSNILKNPLEKISNA